MTESSPSIDVHGVKRDLEKKHWCIPYHLTQNFMGVRTPNLGESVFFYLYTGQVQATDEKIFNLKKKKKKKKIFQMKINGAVIFE